MAEYREFPMVGASLKRTLSSKAGYNENKLPEEYTLNTGHVMFFYNKKRFMKVRYALICHVLTRRGFKINPSNRSCHFELFDKVPCIEWKPSKKDKKLICERLLERYRLQPDWYRYRGKPIEEAEYIDILKRSIKHPNYWLERS
jgi:deoxyribonuclease (pyrimidine dimer)